MSEEKALPSVPEGWNESNGRSFTIEVSQPIYDQLMGFKTKGEIVNELVLSSWASWLPFGWMHSLAAKYYARKAEKLYTNQKAAVEMKHISMKRTHHLGFTTHNFGIGIMLEITPPHINKPIAWSFEIRLLWFKCWYFSEKR